MLPASGNVRARDYRFFAARFFDDFFAVFLIARRGAFFVLLPAVFFAAFLETFFVAFVPAFFATFFTTFLAALFGLLFAAFFTVFLTLFAALFFAPADLPDIGTAGTAGLRECTANMPPCGSMPMAIQSPPGTSIGPAAN